MGRIFCALAASLLMGCGDGTYTLRDATVDMNIMCSSNELAICGDIEPGAYNGADYTDIVELSASYDYTYNSDNSNGYKYLSKTVKIGPCTSYCITLIEDALRQGDLRKGSIKLVIGKEGVPKHRTEHMWIEYTDTDGNIWVLDNIYRDGIDQYSAYNNLFKYVKEYTVWEY